ncbi:rhamnulokinase [Streptomyces sulphureus]|uniref:rhamnulokinase n=1 Tax=Streptomyces sulphureus TaxID=47758 RepID=UPI00035FA083|nr:rhamnulokinase family protein [Streptomyces sulphureus]
MKEAASRQDVAVFAAVDLGATSGRVVTGTVGPGTLHLAEVHRFPNVPVRLPDGLYWNLPALYLSMLEGLRAAARRTPDVTSIGVDTWGVDYALLGADGALLGLPRHHREARTDEAVPAVHALCSPAELYAVTGLQHLPFNTVYQLHAVRDRLAGTAAGTLLLLPDLLAHWLTGAVGAEETNASTTGLLDARTGRWSEELISRLEMPRSLFPALRSPGQRVGTLLPHVAEATQLRPHTPVVTVASHDTASAVAAVPAADGVCGYVSCGTWSLAGLELDAPVLTEESRAANFTNERGIDGTIRYLRNITGMWLLEECRRTWDREDAANRTAHDASSSLGALLAAAAEAEPFAALVDADAPDLLPPGDMPSRLRNLLRRSGQTPPRARGGLVRCVLESLALAHRRTLREAARLSGRAPSRVHLVGGGSRNTLLCQWTADASGLPVTAGPTEATAVGNILVQARAAGLVGGLAEMRALVAATQDVRHYRPRGDPSRWDEAESRLHGPAGQECTRREV